MRQNIKSLSILCMFIVNLALIGIIQKEFSLKYLDDNHNSKNDVISDLRDASGDWDPQITKQVGYSPYSVFIGDANNDGYNDITTANRGSDDVSILLWNNTLGDWNPQITKFVGEEPRSVFIGDANNDGYNDIVTANFYSHNVSILLWDNTLGDWNGQITKFVGEEPRSVFIGDANNDGCNDIVTANHNSDDISILLWNNTLGDWNSQITKPVGTEQNSYTSSIFIEDANNDGLNDIATTDSSVNNVSILLWNNTLGDWDPQITKYVGEWPCSVFIGDANNDGYNDINIASGHFHNISILLWNNTSGDWNPLIIKTVGGIPTCVFIGDANNDGYNDIVTANHNMDSISILLWNNALGDWNPQITKSVGDDPRSVFIGDANNDGLNDIVTANVYDHDVSILLYTSNPIITIISPNQNEFFGNLAPNFEISIDEPDFNTTWYTLDGGITNFIFNELNGTINQLEWENQEENAIIIRFYANDSWGFEGYSEVSIHKDVTAPTSTLSFVPYRMPNIVNETTLFSILANDRHGSGISEKRYKINDSSWIIYKSSFNLSNFSPNYYVITYQAIDNVGNIETENSILVKLIEISESAIPGYNVILFPLIIGVLSIIAISYYSRKIEV